jgi:hypothetical protein
MRPLPSVFAVGVIAVAVFLSKTALSAPFSYQGFLTESGGPANGAFDIRVRLFDAATNGNELVSPVSLASVGVTNGLFNVQLDFGPAAFTGDGRWLELEVRPAGGTNAFTTLAPRQPILAAPFALHAASAQELKGTLGPASLAGAYTNPVSFSSPGNAFFGDGGGLTNLNAQHVNFATNTLSARGATNVIWLAVRQDGRDGVGTATDPRDASTAEKFDAIIGGSRPNTEFHLYPGIYETYGYDVAGTRTNEVKQYSSFIGSGMDSTIIRLRPDTTASIGIVYVLAGVVTGNHPTGEKINFENFTVDANAQNVNPNYTVQSIHSAANNSRFVNLRSIHNRGTTNAECFPFVNGGTNCLTSRCIVTDPVLGSGGISAFGASYNGTVENCYVDGAYIINAAYTIYEGATLRGNRATRVFDGAYADTAPISSCIVENNHFFDVARGVYIDCSTGPFTNIIVSGNLITLRTNANSFVNVSSAGLFYSQNVTVRDNVLDWATEPASQARAAFSFAGTVNLKVTGNRVANSNMVGSYTSFPNTNVQFFNNRTLDGRPIPGLPDTNVVPSYVFISASGTNVTTNGSTITIRIP